MKPHERFRYEFVNWIRKYQQNKIKKTKKQIEIAKLELELAKIKLEISETIRNKLRNYGGTILILVSCLTLIQFDLAGHRLIERSNMISDAVSVLIVITGLKMFH